MAITLSWSDATKLFKQYSEEEIFSLDAFYEQSLVDKREEKLRKEIEKLNRELIKLQNRECLFSSQGIVKQVKEKFKTQAEKVLKRCKQNNLINEEDIKTIYKKYGYYAGARNYGLKLLGETIPIPKDNCDNIRRDILNKYREIRDNEGIKKANEYFIVANNKLKGIKEGDDYARCNFEE